MNKKTILNILLILVAIGGLLWLAKPNNDNNDKNTENEPPQGVAKTRALSANETNYDFGEISMASGKVKHIFQVSNNTNQPTKITKMYTSCMCTTATLKIEAGQFGPFGMPGHGFIPKINQIMNPREEATVEVVFDPAAHGPAGIGRIGRKIIIENDAGEPLELGFSATVKP